MKKSSVYTRTGDSGTTSLVGGTRVPKNSPRLEAYGTIDEANSWLGLLDASDAIPEAAHATLRQAMNHMFDIGSALATEETSSGNRHLFHSRPLPTSKPTLIHSTPPYRHNQFILPGGHADAARANIARTVVRRAERRILALAETAPVDPALLRYINRLSDYLFILSRAINIKNAKQEIFWQKNCCLQ